MAQVEDNTIQPMAGRAPLILGGHDFHSITEAIAEPVERKTPLGWWLFFLPSVGMLSLLGISVAWLFWEGIGVWGLNNPVWPIAQPIFACCPLPSVLLRFWHPHATTPRRDAQAKNLRISCFP